MRKIMIVTLLLLALTVSAHGQVINNQYKLDNIGDAAINPAYLHSNKWFGLSIGIPLDVNFNSWNPSLIKKYGNKDWNDDDKKVILKATNKNHLRLTADTQPYIGLKFGPIGLRVDAQAQAYGQIPSEVIHLMLKGNQLNEKYEFSGVNGEAAGYLGAGGIIAIPMEKFIKDPDMPPITVAASYRYIMGLGYAEFKGDGALETILNDTTAGASTNASGTFAYSTSGSGYALDFGFSTEINDRLTIDGSVLNIGSIKWTDVQQGTASFNGDIDLQNPEDANLESEMSEPEPGDDITWKIPRTFRLGSSYKLTEKTILLADLSWTKSQSLGLTARQAVGIEVAPLKFMPMQLALIKQTKEPIRIDLAWGLRFKHSELNLSVKNASGLVFTKSQGIGLRIDSRIRF